MTDPVLALRALHVSYGKVDAVHGIDLEVHSGQIVTVIGPNGAGKSSLLNAIAGALPTTGNTRGTVLLDGYNLLGVPVEARVDRGTTGNRHLMTRVPAG